MEKCKRVNILQLSFIIFLTVFYSLNSCAAQGRKVSTPKINRPEICWALAHPFKIIPAIHTTKLTLSVVDSLESDSVLTGRSGGELDAFKHGFWMALLANKIGEKAARKLALAHEKSNYLNFKKGRAFSSYKHSLMDSLNNAAGIETGKKYHNFKTLRDTILKQITEGKFYILKTDTKGNYLDCEGRILKKKPEKWHQGECLVKSGKH